MRKFLECTERGTTRKVLIPVDSIVRIVSKSRGGEGFSSILYTDKIKPQTLSIDTWETYEKIKAECENLTAESMEDKIQNALAAKEAELQFKRKLNGTQ